MKANPVATSSGMKLEGVTDVSVGGPNPLEFRRRYQSILRFWRARPDDDSGRLGRGWRSNFDGRMWSTGSPDVLTFLLPDFVEATFRLASGSTTTYERVQWNASGNLVASNKGDWYRLERISSITYVVTDKSNDKYVFENGRLMRILFSSGYYQDLEYDANGRNSKVTDSYGRYFQFAYAANGLLQTMTTSAGDVYVYTYEDRYVATNYVGVPTAEIPAYEWALKSVAYPDGDGNASNNPTVTYHYEDSTYRYALSGITDERGVRYASWTYQSDGRVATSTHAGGAENHSFAYDDTNKKVTVTSPLAKEEVFHFQDDGLGRNRLTRIEGKVSANCAASDGYLAYDANSNPNQVTDQEGRITAITNDSRGLPTQVVEAQGTGVAVTTNTTWDSTYALPSQTQEPGLTTAFNFDPNTGIGPVGGGGGAASPHRFWRIKFISNVAGSGNIGLAELELRAKLGDPNLLHGEALNSSTLAASQGPERAIDGKYGAQNNWDGGAYNYATSVMTGHLGVDLGFGAAQAKVVNHVTMTAYESAYLTGMPAAFDVQYSDVGGTSDADWATAWSVTGQTWTQFQRKTFSRPGYSEPAYTGSPHGSHRYWRLLFLDAAQPYYGFGAADIELRATPGGADQTSGGTAFASGNASGLVPANAFDNSNTTVWFHGLWPSPSTLQRNHFVGYDFGVGNAVRVAQVMFRSRGDATSAGRQAPSLWMLQYSNDNVAWTTAAHITDTNPWADGESRTYTDPLYVP